MSCRDELTVEPFTAPGKYLGEPAYTYMGVQALVHFTDQLSDTALLSRVWRYDRWCNVNKPENVEKNVYAQVAVQRILEEVRHVQL